MRELITTHSLEMLIPEAGRRDTQRSYDLRRVETLCPELNRFLYQSVGADWTWYQRLSWTYSDWLEFLDRKEVATWIAYKGANPVGYFELERQSDEHVEIVYFGLLPQFIGRGMGRALLEDAIMKAGEFGGRRVWLHTCSLDHPAALANYQARGFRIFQTEEAYEELPDQPLQPWPGAHPRVAPAGSAVNSADAPE